MPKLSAWSNMHWTLLALVLQVQDWNLSRIKLCWSIWSDENSFSKQICENERNYHYQNKIESMKKKFGSLLSSEDENDLFNSLMEINDEKKNQKIKQTTQEKENDKNIFYHQNDSWIKRKLINLKLLKNTHNL